MTNAEHQHSNGPTGCVPRWFYDEELGKVKAELQEARRLLREWYSWEHSKSLQERTRAFLGRHEGQSHD